MDFTKVVNKRHSVRQFTDQAVETDLIKEIVTVAQRTPSWVNSQPWQVYCARGTVLQRIKKAYREADQTGQASQPDLPVMSREEWAPRTQANMKQWRHDIVHHFPSFDEAHTAMSTASNNLYDSPVILFITVPQASPDWSIFDTGAFAQTLMPAATNRGLGSIPTYNSVRFPKILRRFLGIPDTERVLVGISLGYPADQPLNHYHSQRVPLSNVLHFN